MTNTTTEVENGVADKSDLPRMQLGEMGSVGLKVDSGTIYEEYREDLIFPNNIRTYKNMSIDPVVDSALKVIKSYIRTLEYKVEIPDGASAEDAKFIEQCMADLDRPWGEYMQEWLSSIVYGYCPAEKVYKRRTKESKYKSKYSDGKLGWAKLPVRSQDTIDKFIFSKDTRELTGIRQNFGLIRNNLYLRQLDNSEKKVIPRAKFMLFRCDPQRDNPQGNSALNGAYIAWRYKTALEEVEAIGISRDLNGLPILKIPPQYMSPNATEEEKAFYEQAKNILRNIEVNEQGGILLPNVFDERGNSLFSFELASVNGGKSSATDDVIKRYENKILMSFMADVLKTGHDGSGSFALADSKTNLLAKGIEYRLTEILDVVNTDLIPQTLALNGINSEITPRIVAGDLEEMSLDELGKYIQRVISVGGVEVDKDMSNALRKRVRLDEADESKPLSEELIGGGESRSGDGMKTAGDGTAKKPDGDSSSSNTENAS